MNNELETTHVCEEAGCASTDTDEYRWFTFDADQPQTTWLCYDHAITNGFCVWCQTFGAGSDDYDFSGHRGYHRDCWDELRAEAGEDIETVTTRLNGTGGNTRRHGTIRTAQSARLSRTTRHVRTTSVRAASTRRRARSDVSHRQVSTSLECADKPQPKSAWVMVAH